MLENLAKLGLFKLVEFSELIAKRTNGPWRTSPYRMTVLHGPIWTVPSIKLWITRKAKKVGNATEKVAFLALLRIIRILRVFRIAKLGRHNQNLNRLVRTIKGSAKEFSFLCLLFTVSMVIFSALGTIFPIKCPAMSRYFLEDLNLGVQIEVKNLK